MNCKIVYLDKHKNANKAQHRVAGSNLKFVSNHNSVIGILQKIKPDLVFVNKGDSFNDINLIKYVTSNYRTAYWFGDWRINMPEFMYNWAQHSAVVFFNAYDPGLWKELKSRGQENVFVIHQGIDPTVFKPLNNIKKIYDVGFGGHNYSGAFPNSKLRIQILRDLKAHGFNVAVVGRSWPADMNPIETKKPAELNEFYNQCRTTIGISHFTDIKYSVSNRLYQCMATGVPHINWHSPGLEKLFDDGYIGTNSYIQMIEKIHQFIDDKYLRNKIGKIQRKQILKYHTLEHAWQRIENNIKKVFPELK